MSDDDIIYRPWPAEVVAETLDTFGYAMRNGADIDALRQGILCIDFICRNSKLTEHQRDLVYGYEVEANMRLDLMLKAAHKNYVSNAEFKADCAVLVTRLEYMTRALQDLCSRGAQRSLEEVLDFIERRNAINGHP